MYRARTWGMVRDDYSPPRKGQGKLLLQPSSRLFMLMQRHLGRERLSTDTNRRPLYSRSWRGFGITRKIIRRYRHSERVSL